MLFYLFYLRFYEKKNLMKTKIESNFFSTLKREKQELQITNWLFYNYFYHVKDRRQKIKQELMVVSIW